MNLETISDTFKSVAIFLTVTVIILEINVKISEWKLRKLSEKIRQIEFSIMNINPVLNVMNVLGYSDDDLADEQKDSCREFCNDFASDDNCYNAGMFYKLVKKNDMETLLPQIVLSNFKFQDAKETIDVRMENIKEWDAYDEIMWTGIETTMQEALVDIKTNLQNGNKNTDDYNFESVNKMVNSISEYINSEKL